MKKLLSKFKFAEYWHLEMYYLVPLSLVWTVLLAIIAFK